jgi:hypothetical protein
MLDQFLSYLKTTSITVLVILFSVAWLIMPKVPGSPSIHTFKQITVQQNTLVDYWMSPVFHRYYYSVRENLALSSWLLQNTDEETQVYIWGRVPVVNYWSKRRSATRFIYNYTFRYPSTSEALEKKLMKGLKNEKPGIFVISSQDSAYRATGTRMDSRQAYMQFENLRKWVNSKYTFVEKIGRFKIARRSPEDS